MAVKQAEPETRVVECTLDEECSMCTGEACLLCGAGLWRSPSQDEKPCEHEVIERHTIVKGSA